MFCHKCGKETTENQAFCSGCGTVLQGLGATNTFNIATPAQVPPEIRGWNWGAFFLGWIWGIGNSVWIALIGLIPVFPVGLVMAIVLGAKGSEWAWAARKWDSVEHFKRTQRTWAIVGLILCIVGVILFAVYIALIVFAVTTVPTTSQA